MAKVSPFHSKLASDGRVYHDNDECTKGNNIEPENKVPGKGGLPLCSECNNLS